jgi:hypothetical protein
MRAWLIVLCLFALALPMVCMDSADAGLIRHRWHWVVTPAVAVVPAVCAPAAPCAPMVSVLPPAICAPAVCVPPAVCAPVAVMVSGQYMLVKRKHRPMRRVAGWIF